MKIKLEELTETEFKLLKNNGLLWEVYPEAPEFYEDIKRQDSEFCICAAVKANDGQIIRCHRHYIGIDYLFERGLSTIEQGFITSKNRFVNRKEGRILQDKAGIASKSKDGYHSDILFSEDLY